MAIDGDNNVSCGRPSCSSCAAAQEATCEYAGRKGLARAVKHLLTGTKGLKLNLEMNVTMMGDAAHGRTGELAALCAATGGRYEAIKEDDRCFLAESFHFYKKLAEQPELHLKARVEAVKGFMDMVKAQKIVDCGVRTRFVGRDKQAWKALVKVDKSRKKLCEKLFGTKCPHQEDRSACVRAARAKLLSPQPFENLSQASTIQARYNQSRMTKELLDSTLFLAKNFSLVDEDYVTLRPSLPPLRGIRNTCKQ